MTTYERFQNMTALGVVWHLLWDRHFGPRIQDRLKKGIPLDDEFCFRIKRQVMRELYQLDSTRIEHIHLQFAY